MTRVVVVDDNGEVRSLVAAVLGSSGCDVADVRDAASVVGLAAERPVDLLVTDVSLGDRSGFLLAREIRGMWPDVAVLYMSGHDVAELARIAAEDGLSLPVPGPADAYLRKPFGLADLRAAVGRLLANGQAADEL